MPEIGGSKHLSPMRPKISPRARLRVIGVWRYFTHLVNRVDYRHALPIFHITSSCLTDGVGVYGCACCANP